MKKCYTKRCVREVVDIHIPMKLRFFAKDSSNILHDITRYVKSYSKPDYRFNITLYDGTIVSLSSSTIVFAENDIDVHLIVEDCNKYLFDLL